MIWVTWSRSEHCLCQSMPTEIPTTLQTLHVSGDAGKQGNGRCACCQTAVDGQGQRHCLAQDRAESGQKPACLSPGSLPERAALPLGGHWHPPTACSTQAVTLYANSANNLSLHNIEGWHDLAISAFTSYLPHLHLSCKPHLIISFPSCILSISSTLSAKIWPASRVLSTSHLPSCPSRPSHLTCPVACYLE